jgi:hypothetical protein
LHTFLKKEFFALRSRVGQRIGRAEEEERSLIKDLKRYAQLAVAKEDRE